MSETQPVDPSAGKPKRSVIERVIVQGGICVLLVVVAIEGLSYFQMKSIHTKLTAELSKAETSDYKVTKKVVDRILQRTPDESKTRKAIGAGEERYDIYYFKGLLKQREICVHYGIQGTEGVKTEPEVVEVTTIIPDEIL